LSSSFCSKAYISFSVFSRSAYAPAQITQLIQARSDLLLELQRLAVRLLRRLEVRTCGRNVGVLDAGVALVAGHPTIEKLLRLLHALRLRSQVGLDPLQRLPAGILDRLLVACVLLPRQGQPVVARTLDLVLQVRQQRLVRRQCISLSVVLLAGSRSPVEIPRKNAAGDDAPHHRNEPGKPAHTGQRRGGARRGAGFRRHRVGSLRRRQAAVGHRQRSDACS
jgi:hypothetical protein